jgi:hypothetical protein
MIDTTRRFVLKRAISPVSGAADNTASVSQIIDKAGFDSLVFATLLGQGSGAPEVDAAFIFSSDDQVRKIGYRGSKRYVRITITPAANTGAWLHGVVAVLGHAYYGQPTQPTA